MGKFLIACAVAVALFVAVESLSCNQCSFGLLGVCLNSGNITCSTNTSVCYTARATFSQLSSFSGFNTQGCLSNTTACGTASSSSLLGVTFTSNITCCSTNNCNTVTLSAAPVNQMALSAALGAAVLATMFSMQQ